MSASLAAAVLDGLGLLPANAQNAGTTLPALSWPPLVAGLTEGSVRTTGGGWDRATSPSSRVTLFAGPELTIAGLAATVHAWLAAIPSPSVAVPDADATARAVLAYNLTDLGADSIITASAAASPARFPGWQVGRAVPLPVEFDPAASTPAFVTDLTLWNTLAATAGTAQDSLLGYPPELLRSPVAADDRVWAQGAVAAAADVAALCAVLRLATLRNPSGQVFRTLAVLLEIDQGSDSDRAAFLTTLINTTFAADELQLLATLSAGAIVLRALYRRLGAVPGSADVTAAIDALNSALGLPPGVSSDLTQQGPSVVPRELVASPTWRVRADATPKPGYDVNGERTDGYHDLVLGRAIYCGKVGTYPVKLNTVPVTYRRFTGPAYVGNSPWKAATFIAANSGDINAGADARLAARLAVVAAIAGNEGNVDAVRLQDGAILALGIQQWSANSDDELTPLLWQLLQTAPDEFDAHFGVYGLGLRLSRSLSDGSPGAVTMVSIPPGGAATAMPSVPPSKPEAPPGRLAFFGGIQADPLTYTFVGADGTLTPWAARVRFAELASRTLQILEIAEAAHRFSKIKDAGWKFTAVPYTVDQLITSVQGAALLLDQHINSPANALADLKAALTVAGTPVTGADGKLADTWLSTYEAAYQAKIHYPGDDATQKIKNTRQGRILAQSLSTTPRSFVGW